MSWLGLPAVERYRNIYLYDLKINHAQVIANTTLSNVGVYSVDDDCIECPYKLIATLNPDREYQWQVDTTTSTTWRIINNGYHTYINWHYMDGLACELRPSLREFGVYRLNIGTCNFEEEVAPIYSYLPLLLFLLTLLNVGIVYTLIRIALNYSKRKLCPKEHGVCLDLQVIEPDSARSLYFFRGILLMLIIFLTSGAGGYTGITKNYGNITLSEIMFYAYIWSLGFKIPSYVNQALERGNTKCRMFFDILKRSTILIISGVMIDAIIAKRIKPEIELCSPLQRAGFSYFVAAISYAYTSKKISTPSENIYFKMLACALSLIWCWVIGVFFFSAQLIGMATVLSFNSNPVPIYHTTDSVDKSDMLSQVTNIHPDHMRDNVNKIFLSHSDFVYLNSYYGFCEGLLGISSSIIQCLVGLKAGTVYLQYKQHGDRIRLWCLWGVVFFVFSVCLVIMSLKVFNLWPIASIFVTSSLSFFFYTAIYMTTEKTSTITNFTVHSCGITSVVILCGHLVFSKSIPFSWDTVFRYHLLYLLQNSWVVTLWLLVGVGLARRKFRLSF